VFPGGADFKVKDSAGNVIERIAALAELVAGRIRAGAIEAQRLSAAQLQSAVATIDNLEVVQTLKAKFITAEGLNLTADSFTIAGQSLRDYISQIVAEITNNKSQALVTSEVGNNSDNTSEVKSADTSQTDASFRDISARQVHLEENLTAGEATISGQLAAGSVSTDSLNAQKFIQSRL